MKYRKFFSLAVCLLILVPFSLAGCGGGGGDNAINSKQPSNTPAIVNTMDLKINKIETDCSDPGVTKVTVYASVIDQNGDSIIGLTTSNFSLYEGSTQIDPNDVDVNFVDQLQLPISVGLLMDYSTSMLLAGATNINPANPGPMEKAVINFIDQLKPNDLAEIIKFANDIYVPQSFIGDKAALIDAVYNMPPWITAGYSAIYDSVKRAIEDFPSEPDRKAVVLITDGWDNNSTIGLDDLIDLAIANNVSIYAIGLDHSLNKQDDSDNLYLDVDSLKQMTEETGGHYYQIESTDEIFAVYQQISDILLLDQYVLKYNSPNHGGVDVTLDIWVDYNGLEAFDFGQFVSCP